MGLGSLTTPSGDEPGFKIQNDYFVFWPLDVPSLTVAPDDDLYAIWPYDKATIAVRRWNKTQGNWETLDLVTTLKEVNTPSIAIGPDNTPYLSWYGSDDWASGIYVAKFNGENWEEVAPGSARENGIGIDGVLNFEPSIALTSDNTIYVAWEAGRGVLASKNNVTLERVIYVRHWNSGS